jgi:hypothetical protein
MQQPYQQAAWKAVTKGSSQNKLTIWDFGKAAISQRVLSHQLATND